MYEHRFCKKKHEYVTLRDCEACRFFPVCEPEWGAPKNTAMAATEEVALPAMCDVSSIKINFQHGHCIFIYFSAKFFDCAKPYTINPHGRPPAHPLSMALNPP